MADETPGEPTRRDFLYVATGTAAAVGGAVAAWPLIDQANPGSAVEAAASLEIDVSAIPPGQQVVFRWRGRPLFVRRRTAKEIAAARLVPLADLPDRLARNANLSPSAEATDANRAVKPEWLVVVGVCTHLGCTPAASTANAPQGAYGGWLCHCHGSDYDTTGRVRTGPAPQNLGIPPYAFTGPTTIKIG